MVRQVLQGGEGEADAAGPASAIGPSPTPLPLAGSPDRLLVDGGVLEEPPRDPALVWTRVNEPRSPVAALVIAAACMEPELSARVRLHCHVLNRDGYVWFHRHHPYPLWSIAMTECERNRSSGRLTIEALAHVKA